MAIIASATDDRVEVVTSDKGQKGDTGTAGLDGVGFDAVRGALLDSPLCRLFTPNKLVDTLAGSLTWTRATTATYIDRYGVVKTAAIDTPREESEGWLIEGASTNLFTYSEDFNNAVWIKTRSSITVDTVSAPNQTLTADTLTDDAQTGTHGLFQSETVTAGQDYTISCFVKAGSQNEAALQFSTVQFGVNLATFNLTTGTIISDSNGSAKIVSLADGWYRVSFSATCVTSGSGALSVLLSQNNGVTNYTGDGLGTVYIWGAQVEALPFASSYIPTTTTTVTRAADVVTAIQQDNMPSSNVSDLSVVGLAKRHGTGVSQVIYGCQETGVSLTAFSGATGSGEDFLFRESSASAVASSGSVAFTTKAFFGGVRSGDSVTSYAGDQAGNTSTLTKDFALDPVKTIRFGSFANGSTPLYGHIKDFRIYDFALNADEVQFLSGVK